MGAGSPLAEAQKLDKLGFNVLPAKQGGKAPQVPWQKYQDIRTSDKLGVWFAGRNPRNFWIMTGRISRIVVLDCDTPEAESYWRSRLGEAMDETCCVKSGKGHHYYFRIRADQPVASRSALQSQIDQGIKFDIRADGTGVIAPPSQHESGRSYEWVRGPEAIVDLPDALRRPEDDEGEPGGGQARSMLSELLGKPPRGTGGRNNWITRVAGHYAKHFRTMRDAYETHVRQANDLMESPLEEAELAKTIESIWSAEQRKMSEGPAPSEANGYLVSGGDSILVQTRRKVGNEVVVNLEPWSDFDIVAVGVVEDEEANRTYDVEIKRRRSGDVRRALFPAIKLARQETLAAWLGEYGVGIMAPDAVWPKAGTLGERMRRYLEAQEPPQFQVVSSLGWHADDGFVTHEGVIRADGLHGFGRHKPDPKLRNWAPYRYGFVEEEVAQSVLAEVLTFHVETVCAVFGAWWAACLLKPQIHDVASQFPFMALEAPSESGKTTGFFSLMLQLNGNTQGQVDPTRAALRDWMSANQSGIVWIDDLSETQHLMDLLRQATGEGSVGKKGEDRTAQQVVRLVAPICISGEALQLQQQKALVDRAVLLDVPSPTTRRSLHDPDKLQWQDIVALRERHPDLCGMAGTYVKMALARASMIGDLAELTPGIGGRFGDKIAVIRLGARLLAEIVGEDEKSWVVERVEEWCQGQADLGSENTLTMKLIPQALVRNNWPIRPQAANGRWPATPAFVDGDHVWFSPQALADWWSEIRHGRIESRTETAEALAQQARALGLGGARNSGDRKQWKLQDEHGLARHNGSKLNYWRLPAQLSSMVMLRAQDGGRTQGETQGKTHTLSGVHPGQHKLELDAEYLPEG